MVQITVSKVITLLLVFGVGIILGAIAKSAADRYLETGYDDPDARIYGGEAVDIDDIEDRYFSEDVVL